jgi:2'-5' RNA ligase
MGMVSLLIGLELPKSIKESIEKLRKYIVKKDDKNSYGNHDAHITLFVNTFRSFSEVDKEIQKIAKKTKPFEISTEGAYTFPYDPFNIGKTVVYKIEDNESLRNVQQLIYDNTNPFRTPEQVEWIRRKNPNLSEDLQKNVDKYGFPFAPENYVHHATIGVISDKNYDPIWKYIQKNDLKKKWKVNYLTTYINLGNDGFQPYKRYKLR